MRSARRLAGTHSCTRPGSGTSGGRGLVVDANGSARASCVSLFASAGRWLAGLSFGRNPESPDDLGGQAPKKSKYTEELPRARVSFPVERWRLPGRRKCMLRWVLVAAAGSLPSCGSDHPQTCLERVITYTGSKSGAAYSRFATDNGDVYIPSYAASIQFMILGESGSSFCAGGGNHIDRPFTWIVWIDVSGTAAASCADMSYPPNPQCQPSPGDPQGHQSGVLRFGQVTRVSLDVVDPP